MINYNKLFAILKDRGIKKTDLLKIMSTTSLRKLNKGENLTTETINRLCEMLECQPGDLMEYVPDAPKKKSSLDKLMDFYKAGFDCVMDMSEEEFAEAKKNPMKAFTQTLETGKTKVRQIHNQHIIEDKENEEIEKITYRQGETL